MMNIVSESLLVKDVEEQLNQSDKNRELLEKFLDGEGPQKIFVFYQVHEQVLQDEIKDTGNAEPVLFMTIGEEKIKEKAVWFLRTIHRDSKKQMVNL